MKVMRFILLLVPALVFAQAAATTKTAPKMASKTTVTKGAPVVKNFKESGNTLAKVTLELYTDYECPHCAHFYKEFMPKLVADFVQTGKVKLIHRDFPLTQNFKYSGLAARYANAAGMLGHYDPVVYQLFRTQSEWGQNGNIEASLASVLKPDVMAKVKNLVATSKDLDASVQADMAVARRDQVSSTPTLMVVKNGNREKLDRLGDMSYAVLAKYLNEKLK